MIGLLLGIGLFQDVPALGTPPAHARAGCERAGNAPDRCADAALPASGPRPRFAPGGLVSYADYPPAALAQEQSGTVVMRLTVSPQGRVARCDITRTSGYALLDKATCDLVTVRAAFDPARDSQGRTIESLATLPVSWRIEK